MEISDSISPPWTPDFELHCSYLHKSLVLGTRASTAINEMATDAANVNLTSSLLVQTLDTLGAIPQREINFEFDLKRQGKLNLFVRGERDRATPAAPSATLKQSNK